jgi:UDP-glucose:(heptosyl)LPS alpha-1,3-glucosyltransferase
VDLKTFNPKNRKKYFQTIRNIYNIDKDQTVLVFAGNPFERKGLEYVLRAASEIREDTKLFVIGKYSQDEFNQFTKIATDVGVKDKTIFVGLTNEINKYFAASDIFVLPTLYEPFGLVILEAMASGLPVVVSSIAGAAELITDGKDGMLLENPENPTEIANKVNYIIENENNKKQIGKLARAAAEQYSWQRTAEGMMEVFEKSLRG